MDNGDELWVVDDKEWWKQLGAFQRKVYRVLLKIPLGETRTYGEVARMAGSPKAARAVGNALRENRWAPVIPCHRVVASGGKLGDYSGPGGAAAKSRLLAREKALAQLVK